jgi:hydrogenase/urease accessory protein HupE
LAIRAQTGNDRTNAVNEMPRHGSEVFRNTFRIDTLILMKPIAQCVRSFDCICLAVALSHFLTPTACAHDPGLSTATVTVGEQQIEVVIGLARQDAALILPANVRLPGIGTTEGFEAMRRELESITASGFNIYLGDQRVVPAQTTAQLKDSTNVEILLRFWRTSATQLRLVATFFERFPLGHRQFLSVQTASGARLGEAMLSAKKNAFQISLPAVSGSTAARPVDYSFLEFLKFGVEHILTGYDHLLFLFGLMVICRDLRSILAVITCFTFAHSITLALAAVDIVRLPGRVVEPLIAASIAYVGIENLLRGDSAKWRSLLAFSFGLVHGLGFAEALRELGINSARFGIVASLLGFNVGVELGQLAVAVIVLPILWHLRRYSSFVRLWVPICSLAVAFAGSYWMVERIMQK